MKKFLLVCVGFLVVLCLLVSVGLVSYSSSLSTVFQRTFNTLNQIQEKFKWISDIFAVQPEVVSTYQVATVGEFYFVVQYGTFERTGVTPLYSPPNVPALSDFIYRVYGSNVTSCNAVKFGWLRVRVLHYNGSGTSLYSQLYSFKRSDVTVWPDSFDNLTAAMAFGLSKIT